MPNQNNRNKDDGKVKTGMGLAALAAAAAAGAYYFYGSRDSAKHRKALKGWVVKAKGDVMQQIEKLQNVDRETYDKVVDQVISRYRGAKNISVGELVSLGKELKGHWNNIMKDVNKSQLKPAARSKARKPKKTSGAKS